MDSKQSTDNQLESWRI